MHIITERHKATILPLIFDSPETAYYIPTLLDVVDIDVEIRW